MIMRTNFIDKKEVFRYDDVIEFDEIEVKKNINISMLENNVLNIDVENNEGNEINITKLDKNNFRIIF